MPEVPNVNDGGWLNDRVEREDVALVTNAIGAAVGGLRRDLLPGIARIFDGLKGAQGATPDKVKVLAGSSQDVDGKRVYLAAESAEVDLLSTSGSANYFAIKHKYTYDNFEKAYFSGVKYYQTRRDDYEVHVSTGPQDEAAGYVRVFNAYKSGGALKFDYSYRSYDEVLFAKEYVLNLAEFDFDENLTEVPGQWRPAPYTWQYKTIRVCLADSYTALAFDALPVDLDVCVDVDALDVTYTLGVIKDISGLTDITIGVQAPAATPNKLFMVVVEPTPNLARVKGKVELLGIPGKGAAE
ncbi:MAG: hypothetical protein V3W11_03400 [bacterium]